MRVGRVTFVAEVPFTYTGFDDRYLAVADLLFDLLAPSTEVRHRALVRIEDVGPHSDPAQLRSIADYLSSRNVPFAVAVFPVYDDAAGVYSGGVPVHKTLSGAPLVVDALRYMVAHGGTLIMHGYTHGFAGAPNPYGVSAEDYEFYRAHLDAAGTVVLDGPVPGDSAEWALGRLAAARQEWTAAGLTPPDIWEFPPLHGQRGRLPGHRLGARHPGQIRAGPLLLRRAHRRRHPGERGYTLGEPVLPIPRKRRIWYAGHPGNTWKRGYTKI